MSTTKHKIWSEMTATQKQQFMREYVGRLHAKETPKKTKGGAK